MKTHAPSHAPLIIAQIIIQMGTNKIVQLFNTSPDELTGNILKGVKDQLEKFKEDLKPQQAAKWLTREETKEMLSVSYVTLHSWSKKGILHSYKIGNKIRYKHSEVESALVKVN